MKKYLAIYLSSPKASEKWNALSESERKAKQTEGIKAWYGWSEKNSKYVKDGGAPLGKTKRIEQTGISDTKNLMTAYTLVEAESHEAAAKLFSNHPHFTIFPGDSIEIMECLDIPTR